MSYTVITGKETETGLNWVLDAKKPLSDVDMNFVKSFAPVTHWNDVEDYAWTFDVQLPSGRWLENMKFTEDGATIKALIL